MRFTELARAIPCAGDNLAGVIALPAQPLERGVVIIVGGPQYRVGSHRQFVQLARHLAAQGIATLRFDCRGMGDSSGAQRGFEDFSEDVHCAIGALLAAVPAVRNVALWGLCDGASAALLYLAERADPRVAALCLVNPWVRSAQSLARTHIERHYRHRLYDPSFWRRLVTGRVGFEALAGWWTDLKLSRALRGRTAVGPDYPFQRRMAQGWRSFAGQILLVLSENDYTADEFRGALAGDPIWSGAASHARLERHDADGADHTLSDPRARESVERLTSAWLLKSIDSGGRCAAVPAHHPLERTR